MSACISIISRGKLSPHKGHVVFSVSTSSKSNCRSFCIEQLGFVRRQTEVTSLVPVMYIEKKHPFNFKHSKKYLADSQI